MSKEIRSLTGLRGIAAVIVMAYHFVIVPKPFVGVSLGPCYLMVDLFFVLSGFVMARTYGASFAPGRARWRAFRIFLQARFARIYPLYAVAIVTEFALAKLHVIRSASFPVRAFISNVPLLQNLGAGYIAPGFAAYLDPPSWSISTEAGAYLLFPALASLALFRPPRSAVGLSVLCGGVLFALSVVPRPWLNQPAGLGALDISSGETLWPLLRCLAGFCIGLVAYRLSFRLTSWRRTAAADIILVAALAGLWYADVSDFAIVCLFPLLILQVCTDRSPLARWLGTWLPYRLGLWSYAIYLLHWPALDLLNPIEGLLRRHDAPRPHLTALLVLAMLLIGASAALYEGFEKPARNFLRRGFGQRRTTTAMEPSAP